MLARPAPNVPLSRRRSRASRRPGCSRQLRPRAFPRWLAHGVDVGIVLPSAARLMASTMTCFIPVLREYERGLLPLCDPDHLLVRHGSRHARVAPHRCHTRLPEPSGLLPAPARSIVVGISGARRGVHALLRNQDKTKEKTNPPLVPHRSRAADYPARDAEAPLEPRALTRAANGGSRSTRASRPTPTR
jgi:hypothetical protein